MENNNINTLEDIRIKFKINNENDYAELLYTCLEGDIGYGFEIESDEEREKIIKILIDNVEFPITHYHFIMNSASKYHNIYVIEKLLNYSKIDKYAVQYIGHERFHDNISRAMHVLTMHNDDKTNLIEILLEKFPFFDYSDYTNSLLEYSYKHNNQKLTDSLLENVSICNSLFDVSIFERLNESNHEHFSR
jgi:hypothetical protein